jgi:hypothetical protein
MTLETGFRVLQWIVQMEGDKGVQKYRAPNRRDATSGKWQVSPNGRFNRSASEGGEADKSTPKLIWLGVGFSRKLFSVTGC